MRVWPGRPYPLGATWTGWASTSRSSPSTPPASSCACSIRPTRPRQSHAFRCPSTPTWSGTAICPTSAGPALRLSRPRPVRAAARASLQSAQGAARSVRQGDRPRRALGRRAVRLHASAIERRPVVRRARQRRRSRRWPRSIDPAFTWGDDARRARRGTRRSSTSCTSRASRSCIRTCPSRCAARTRRCPEPAIEHLTKLGVTAVELLPVHHHARRPAPRSNSGLTQLLGLQHARLLRPRLALLGVDARRTARSASSRRWCAALHARRHRGDSRRRLQPHRRRAITSARRCRCAASTTPAYYRLVPRRPRYYHGLHRLRQHAEHADPQRAAADHGQPALLGAGDARRRVPLRPGEHAGARAARGRTSSARSSTSSTRTRCCRR